MAARTSSLERMVKPHMPPIRVSVYQMPKTVMQRDLYAVIRDVETGYIVGFPLTEPKPHNAVRKMKKVWNASFYNGYDVCPGANGFIDAVERYGMYAVIAKVRVLVGPEASTEHIKRAFSEIIWRHNLRMDR